MQPNSPNFGDNNDLNENKSAKSDYSNSFVVGKRTILGPLNSTQANDGDSPSANIKNLAAANGSVVRDKKIVPLANSTLLDKNLPLTNAHKAIELNDQRVQQPIDTDQVIFSHTVNDNPMPKQNRLIKKSNFLRNVLLMVMPLVIIGLGIGSYFAYIAYQNRPSHVFSEALNNSFHQTIFSETKQNSYRLINANNPKDIIAYYSFQLASGKLIYGGDVYSSNNSTYVKFLGTSKTNLDNSKLAGIINKWALLYSKVDSNNQSILSSFLSSAPSLILGEWIEGNFTSRQTTTILHYIADHDIYSFNPREVKKTMINHQETFDFPVSIKPLAMESYNKMVAQMLGMNSAQQTSIVNKLSTSGINKLNVYVSLANDQVVRTIANSNIGLSGSTIINYAYKNQVHFPAQPKAQISKSVLLNDLSKYLL